VVAIGWPVARAMTCSWYFQGLGFYAIGISGQYWVTLGELEGSPWGMGLHKLSALVVHKS